MRTHCRKSSAIVEELSHDRIGRPFWKREPWSGGSASLSLKRSSSVLDLRPRFVSVRPLQRGHLPDSWSTCWMKVYNMSRIRHHIGPTSGQVLRRLQHGKGLLVIPSHPRPPRPPRLLVVLLRSGQGSGYSAIDQLRLVLVESLRACLSALGTRRPHPRVRQCPFLILPCLKKKAMARSGLECEGRAAKQIGTAEDHTYHDRQPPKHPLEGTKSSFRKATLYNRRSRTHRHYSSLGVAN